MKYTSGYNCHFWLSVSKISFLFSTQRSDSFFLTDESQSGKEPPCSSNPGGWGSVLPLGGLTTGPPCMIGGTPDWKRSQNGTVKTDGQLQSPGTVQVCKRGWNCSLQPLRVDLGPKAPVLRGADINSMQKRSSWLSKEFKMEWVAAGATRSHCGNACMEGR